MRRLGHDCGGACLRGVRISVSHLPVLLRDIERLVAIDGLVRTALRYLLDSILEAECQDVAISAGIEGLVLRPLLRQVH